MCRSGVLTRIIRIPMEVYLDETPYSEKNTLQKMLSLCYYSKHGAHKQRYNKKHLKYHQIKCISNCPGGKQDTRCSPKVVP